MERCGTRSREILGTATTCSTSASASIFCKSSTTWSPNYGTSTSRICTYGKMSTMRAAVPPTVAAPRRRSVGRAASTSPSSSSVKYCVLAASGEGVFCQKRCATRSPLPWPWPSFGTVRHGACTWPGPCIVSAPRTQPPFSSALRSTHHGLPARLTHDNEVTLGKRKRKPV